MVGMRVWLEGGVWLVGGVWLLGGVWLVSMRVWSVGGVRLVGKGVVVRRGAVGWKGCGW